MIVFRYRARYPERSKAPAGYINAIGSVVSSEMKPVIVGPMKYPAMEMTQILAMPSEGGTPGISALARM